MKKFLLLLMILALPVTSFASSTSYTCSPVSYPVMVNGQVLTFTDAPPMNYNGRTMLPLRSISEAVGVPIEWNNTKKSVEITTLDVDKLKESCVMIYAYGDGMTSQGSGVYTDYDQVLTAYHVIDEDRNLIYQSDKTTLSAINFNSDIDIATLKASKNVKPVKIGDSDDVKAGDKVIVIGAPNGKEDTVIHTTVKALTSDIVISYSTNSGSSGGGLFNVQGELIGIVVAGSKGSDESYAIPINTIRKSL